MKTYRRLGGIGLAAGILLAPSPRTAWAQPEIPREYTINGFAIEYEYHWDNNVPEVARCIEFVRNYRE